LPSSSIFHSPSEGDPSRSPSAEKQPTSTTHRLDWDDTSPATAGSSQPEPEPESEPEPELTGESEIASRESETTARVAPAVVFTLAALVSMGFLYLKTRPPPHLPSPDQLLPSALLDDAASPAEVTELWQAGSFPFPPEYLEFGQRLAKEEFGLDEVFFLRGGGSLIRSPAFSFGDALSAKLGRRTPCVSVCAPFMPHTLHELTASRLVLMDELECASAPTDLNVYQSTLDGHCRAMIAHELAHVGMNHRSEAALSFSGAFLGSLGALLTWDSVSRPSSRHLNQGVRLSLALQFALLCGFAALRYSQHSAELRADRFAAQVVGVEATVSFLCMLTRNRAPQPAPSLVDRVLHFFVHTHPSTEERVRSVVGQK